jgi:hypothetical protein
MTQEYIYEILNEFPEENNFSELDVRLAKKLYNDTAASLSGHVMLNIDNLKIQTNIPLNNDFGGMKIELYSENYDCFNVSVVCLLNFDYYDYCRKKKFHNYEEAKNCVHEVISIMKRNNPSVVMDYHEKL